MTTINDLPLEIHYYIQDIIDKHERYEKFKTAKEILEPKLKKFQGYNDSFGEGMYIVNGKTILKTILDGDNYIEIYHPQKDQWLVIWRHGMQWCVASLIQEIIST